MNARSNRKASVSLTAKELSKKTWSDFEAVLGTNGGARGCWCMHWRLSIEEWTKGKGEGNKQAMKRLAQRKTPPGVVVYDGDDTPVAWCSLGPRSSFPRLERSPLLASVDDEPVCAIACVYVQKEHRDSGLLPAILEAVCDYAASAGYEIAEGYPVEPRDGKRAGADTAMTGIASAFLKAGFSEVARPRGDRPIMRRKVK
ncbi:GNAT family N-acetyltransferase [Streptosporangium sp. NPDC023615]|uniref:GNAT family N-acetyltransferase n=1 Tax=Streptosporangium sp. NPDC023615 TaxID=3154794 RepID=UPI0034232612